MSVSYYVVTFTTEAPGDVHEMVAAFGEREAVTIAMHQDMEAELCVDDDRHERCRQFRVDITEYKSDASGDVEVTKDNLRKYLRPDSPTQRIVVLNTSEIDWAGVRAMENDEHARDYYADLV
jgi:hypothetical protein